MVSSTENSSLCAICGKTSGHFTCRGCDQRYCANHVIEHRQILGQKMDEVMLEHDQLRESLHQRTDRLCFHLLVQQINEWEERSIELIHQAATESRNQLCNAVDRFKNKITERLGSLTQELSQSHANETFVETDLNVWLMKLEQLKNEVVALPTINIEKDCCKTPFITKLLVIETPEDIFQKSIGNVKIEDNGKAITHGFWSSYGTVRSRGEYSLGCHKFRFTLENFLGPDRKYFFGITSKVTPMKAIPFTDTAYGWMGYDPAFAHILKNGKYKSYQSLGENDTLELLICCDQRKIYLTNERTNDVEEITIDVDKCPFPWQLHFSLYSWYQRIRLLITP